MCFRRSFLKSLMVQYLRFRKEEHLTFAIKVHHCYQQTYEATAFWSSWCLVDLGVNNYYGNYHKQEPKTSAVQVHHSYQQSYKATVLIGAVKV